MENRFPVTAPAFISVVSDTSSGIEKQRSKKASGMNVSEHPWIVKLASYLVPLRVEKRKGKMTTSLEVILENGRLKLDTARVNYSFGSLHAIFLETFNSLDFKKREVEKVLILGFGAGSVASLLMQTFQKDCAITGVENDEVVIDLARKHFHTDKFPKLRIHRMDACEFVLNCRECFDLIVVDVFVDGVTPPGFSETPFLSRLNNLLSESGMICYNRMVSTPEAKKSAEDLTKRMDKLIGANFHLEYNMGGCLNWVIVHDRKAIKGEMSVVE